VKPSAPSSTLPSQDVHPPVSTSSSRKKARVALAEPVLVQNYQAPRSSRASASRGPDSFAEQVDSPVVADHVDECPGQGGTPPLRMVFAEFFAGQGDLTRTMRDRGIWCRAADDAATGGIDFGVKEDLDKLKEELRGMRTEGLSLALHLAPPWSTFSRARDRSSTTRLRSSNHPDGRPDVDADQRRRVTTANQVALNSFDLAVWAGRDLSAVVTLENPSSSYIWAFFARARPRFKIRWEDLKLSQCLFGAPWRKDLVVLGRRRDQRHPFSVVTFGFDSLFGKCFSP
jgi:hypothetical protein